LSLSFTIRLFNTIRNYSKKEIRPPRMTQFNNTAFTMIVYLEPQQQENNKNLQAVTSSTIETSVIALPTRKQELQRRQHLVQSS
jgi:hypothetical protein